MRFKMEALRYDTYFVEDNIHGDSKVLGVISFFSVQFVENRLKSGTVHRYSMQRNTEITDAQLRPESSSCGVKLSTVINPS